MQTLRTLLTGLFIATASISMAQVTVSTLRLNGTKWIIKGDTSGDFDEYTMSQRIWRRKDGSFSTYPYYITDTPITSYEYSKFDDSKVGKACDQRTYRYRRWNQRIRNGKVGKLELSVLCKERAHAESLRD